MDSITSKDTMTRTELGEFSWSAKLAWRVNCQQFKN
jgi:hypothetical protein